MDDVSQVRARIEKDIRMFYDNMSKLKPGEIGRKTVELSEMYAKDSKSYLDKSDYYTSFSCISYAHGLLDAVIAIRDENVH
ncbi:MAG: DUF357 domain-containing protein [Candidatus Micrarchaeota archaeon]|nr:DUF357 domain-containing protein [Candidatus Micrarchaeota archaeon]